MENRTNKFKEIIKTKYFLIPFLALSLLCFLVVISGLNKPHLNPFAGRLTTLYPTAASYSDTGSLLVDNDSMRLLICNEEDKLTAVADAGMYGCPVDKFTTVTTYRDRIYVIGYTSYNHGMYLSAEKIVEYDMNGNLAGTVYSETYTEEDKESFIHFSNLTATDDGIYLTKIDGHKLIVVFLNNEEWTSREFFSCELPETGYVAGYDSSENYCIAVGVSGNCYYISCDTDEITTGSFSNYLKNLIELNGVNKEEIDLQSFSGYFCIPSMVLSEDGKDQFYCILNSEGAMKLVLSKNMSRQEELSAIEYSTSLQLKTIGFWLAAAVICIELTAFLVWLLFIKGGSNSIKVLLLVGIIVLVSFFYIDWLNDSSEKNYITSLKTQSGQISLVLTRLYGDSLEEIQKKGVYNYCTDVDNQPELEQLCAMLNELCNVNDSEHSVYAGIYLYDNDGLLYTFADSNSSFTTGEPVLSSESFSKILSDDRQGIVTEEDFLQTVVYNYEYIYSREGKILGILLLCGLRGNLKYMQAQDTINLTVSITALLIGVYMLYTMVKTFSSDLLRRRGRDLGDLEGKSLDLSGILAFTRNVIYLLDSAIAVYVAKSLCHGYSTSVEALLVSLPVTAATFGGMIGLSACPFFRRHIGDRSAAVLSSLITLADMLLLAFSVQISSIWLYTAGSFIKGFFLGGTLYALIQTIPLMAKSDSGRRTALASVTQGTTSSSILSVLAGGYVSEYLSYSSVYLLGAAVSAVLLFICLLVFIKNPGKSMVQSDTDTKKSASSECWTFFLKGPGLIYILCYIIPWSTTCGYGRFLFPLYTSEAGISALLLSNLTVFVRTFSFLAINPVREFSRRIDNDFAMAVPLLVTCLCLICFILSPNIYWAIAVLFISELMSRAQQEPSWMYLTELAESHNLDAGQVCSNELTIESLFNTVRTPLLSSAVSLGIYYACATVGTVCGGLCTIFLFYLIRQKKQAKL